MTASATPPVPPTEPPFKADDPMLPLPDPAPVVPFIDHGPLLRRAAFLQAYGAVLISLIVVVAFFGLMVMLLTKAVTVPQDLHDVVIAMLMAVQTAFTSSIAYWLGSSAGSARKDSAPPPTGASTK